MGGHFASDATVTAPKVAASIGKNREKVPVSSTARMIPVRGANDGGKESGHTNDHKVLRCRIEIRYEMCPYRKEKSSGLGTHSEHRCKETSGRSCRVRDGTKRKVEEKAIAKCSEIKAAVKSALGQSIATTN